MSEKYKDLVWIHFVGVSKEEILKMLGFEIESGHLMLDGKVAVDVDGNKNITPDEVLTIVPSINKEQKFGIITDISQLEGD